MGERTQYTAYVAISQITCYNWHGPSGAIFAIILYSFLALVSHYKTHHL